MHHILSIVAAGVEVKGTSAGLSGKTFQQTIGKNEYKAVEVSIFWQIPQYILLAISEVFTGLTGKCILVHLLNL